MFLVVDAVCVSFFSFCGVHFGRWAAWAVAVVLALVFSGFGDGGCASVVAAGVGLSARRVFSVHGVGAWRVGRFGGSFFSLSGSVVAPFASWAFALFVVCGRIVLALGVPFGVG
ncbi:hypothetical protein [Klebsiella pneumoniae]|uniref:hypothetical protein n=1 Tax=Klebsiella pneumoniae TaxID=573 RepID=UPI0011551C3A|nr:hypothetical protein [Klebsiella pneumoniae]